MKFTSKQTPIYPNYMPINQRANVCIIFLKISKKSWLREWQRLEPGLGYPVS